MHLSTVENHQWVSRPIEPPVMDLTCDVLCVGAGSAGIYAADAAARQGAKVILLENDVTVGGMHLLGEVRGYYYGFAGGSFAQDDLHTPEDEIFFLSDHKGEKKKLRLLHRLQESGVTLLCSHTPTGILMEGRRVVGLQVFDGCRQIHIGAKMTIDATSDGHLIRMCPVKKSYGRAPDGRYAPFSLISTYIKDGKRRRINRDAGIVDPYDSRDLSHKLLLAHAQAKEHLGKGALFQTAPHLGIREGLRYESEEALSCEKILLGPPPEKILFWAYSDLDRHGHEHALEEELFQSWWVISNLATVTVRIPVPLGCVVPKDLLGIVTAGRCYGTDSYAQSAVRMNRDMFRMGECVGVAAAIAAESNTSLTQIDYAKYLQTVTALGCFAGDEKKSFGFDFPLGDRPYTPVSFVPEDALPRLQTEAPGPGIWSCFLHQEDRALADRLFDTMNNTRDHLYQNNLALALGIMGDPRALPRLRRIVSERDCFSFKDGRRSNQLRSAAAICLLGRLGVPEDLPLLEEIVFEEREFEKALYHTLEPNDLYDGQGRNFIYFDLFSHAATALVKIHQRHELAMTALHQRFQHLLDEGTVLGRIAPHSLPHEPAYTESRHLLEYVIAQTAPKA
ncbi:MAG: FAD-dependent oxidoreductase [Clostridia bacterium]|nr:FAD-dependent oxidoreductase [Clostridia bacterium]